ncbi:MAG: hypothetical protein GY796_16035 [Chloroflexi bacterium]|nr:hypothetical protein [Chloroflexota bacterium]
MKSQRYLGFGSVLVVLGLLAMLYWAVVQPSSFNDQTETSIGVVVGICVGVGIVLAIVGMIYKKNGADTMNEEPAIKGKELLWILIPVLLLSLAMAFYKFFVEGTYFNFIFVFALLPGIFRQIPMLTTRKHLQVALSILCTILALFLLGNEVYLAAIG